MQEVKDLTYADGFCTCPLWYARLDWVSEVIRLRRWYLKGQLQLRQPNPSAVLIDALDRIDDSTALREGCEFDKLEQERAEQEAKRKQGGSRGREPPTPAPINRSPNK